MSSTYSTSLRLQLMGTGDQSGTWGTTTNQNLGTLLEQAITGYQSISINGLTSYSLTSLNGVTDQSRNAVLSFTGTLPGVCTVTAPAVQKTYIINNATSGGYGITINTTSSGAGVTVPAGQTYIVYSDSTNFYFASNFNSSAVNITGGTIDNTTIGSITPTAGSFTTLTAQTIAAASAYNITFAGTGAITLPTGTTAQEPTSPAVGMIRYNTTIGSFEGYNGSSWGSISGGGNATSIGLWQNKQIISQSQTISSGYSASSAGPINLATPYTSSSVTITIGSPTVFSVTGSTYAAGTTMTLSTTGTLPTGLSAGTNYYVINSASGAFNLSATYNGTAINTTGTQSGVQTVNPTVFVTVPAGSRWVIL